MVDNEKNKYMILDNMSLDNKTLIYTIIHITHIYIIIYICIYNRYKNQGVLNKNSTIKNSGSRSQEINTTCKDLSLPQSEQPAPAETAMTPRTLDPETVSV